MEFPIVPREPDVVAVQSSLGTGHPDQEEAQGHGGGFYRCMAATRYCGIGHGAGLGRRSAIGMGYGLVTGNAAASAASSARVNFGLDKQLNSHFSPER